MKKTLIITLEFPPQVGGIATYVEQQAIHLDLTKTIILAPKNIQAKEWDKQQKYKIYRKKFFWFLWPRWFRLLWQVFWLCRKEKIEMILVHHVLPVGYIAVIMKKLKKIPFIVFSHGTDIVYATRSKHKIRLLKKVIQKSEKVFFNSQSLRNRFLRVIPELESKTDIIYPCPDKDFLIAPDKNDLDLLRAKLALEGKKVMLTVSRIDEGKGVTHITRLLPDILKKEPNLVWVLIGDGPKRSLIIKEIQKHNLQNVVRYLGSIPHDQLKNYYYLADIFVLLCHPDEGREEGLGLVFLESAACGIPAVAGRSGGVEEAVVHTQTGLVVDVYQQMTVVSAITELLANNDYRQKLGIHAQERIKANFNWTNQLSKLDEFLNLSEINNQIDLKF
ncbi:MAG TPA: glycosyltransferase family 4 protein [Candidatus Magasanikbacteria bacterium]|jgi:phosphatidylinositol alpha-1,6-mannosyltransferase|nr:glycosyltransferase family 4 protein [Candidatus Magasanikbacteria bacterium]HQF57188.1 glycosyltransferase family 4 protein [Candidatus Magasanikbacteria bacterium]HQL52484.1 glycosyltransferase family 4 protein [Candidatus Magasanikbacteria bacterium]